VIHLWPICVAEAPALTPVQADENSRAVGESLSAAGHITQRLVGVPIMTDVRPHLRVLDGWRGLSIALVLAAHLFPLAINDSIGDLGMVIFFNLSGFLITSLLLDENVTTLDFLIRRLFRIVPLAWLYMAIVFLFQDESTDAIVRHLLFLANLPPKSIRLATDHLWSLCVEVQFYVAVAFLFLTLRRRGLLLLPVFALACTALRISEGVHDSSITWLRVDEILAGCTLALIYHGRLGKVGAWIASALRGAPQVLLAIVLALSCLRQESRGTDLAYARPYLGAIVVGATIFNSDSALVAALNRRMFYFLATISYALYVVHIGLAHTWLGSGELLERYAKRPLLLAVVFSCAYASTHYFERPAMRIGKRLSAWAHRPSHLWMKS
jgi:peptidoglycan/LPS O-acetylase OafA/YrhL